MQTIIPKFRLSPLSNFDMNSGASDEIIRNSIVMKLCESYDEHIETIEECELIPFEKEDTEKYTCWYLDLSGFSYTIDQIATFKEYYRFCYMMLFLNVTDKMIKMLDSNHRDAIYIVRLTHVKWLLSLPSLYVFESISVLIIDNVAVPKDLPMVCSKISSLMELQITNCMLNFTWNFGTCTFSKYRTVNITHVGGIQIQFPKSLIDIEMELFAANNTNAHDPDSEENDIIFVLGPSSVNLNITYVHTSDLPFEGKVIFELHGPLSTCSCKVYGGTSRLFFDPHNNDWNEKLTPKNSDVYIRNKDWIVDRNSVVIGQILPKGKPSNNQSSSSST